MDGLRYSPADTIDRNYKGEDFAAELVGWFSVSGDMDDFIFYDEEDREA